MVAGNDNARSEEVDRYLCVVREMCKNEARTYVDT